MGPPGSPGPIGLTGVGIQGEKVSKILLSKVMYSISLPHNVTHTVPCIENSLIFIIVQGIEGPRGPPGPRGIPGEGFPGPKVCYNTYVLK